MLLNILVLVREYKTFIIDFCGGKLTHLKLNIAKFF